MPDNRNLSFTHSREWLAFCSLRERRVLIRRSWMQRVHRRYRLVQWGLKKSQGGDNVKGRLDT